MKWKKTMKRQMKHFIFPNNHFAMNDFLSAHVQFLFLFWTINVPSRHIGYSTRCRNVLILFNCFENVSSYYIYHAELGRDPVTWQSVRDQSQMVDLLDRADQQFPHLGCHSPLPRSPVESAHNADTPQTFRGDSEGLEISTFLAHLHRLTEEFTQLKVAGTSCRMHRNSPLKMVRWW